MPPTLVIVQDEPVPCVTTTTAPTPTLVIVVHEPVPLVAPTTPTLVVSVLHEPTARTSCHTPTAATTRCVVRVAHPSCPPTTFVGDQPVTLATADREIVHQRLVSAPTRRLVTGPVAEQRPEAAQPLPDVPAGPASALPAGRLGRAQDTRDVVTPAVTPPAALPTPTPSRCFYGHTWCS